MISLSRFDTGVYIPEYISVHSHALSEVNTTLSIALSIVSKSPNLGNVFLCISLRHIRNAGFLSRIYLFTHISLLINWTVNSPCQNYRYQIYALHSDKMPRDYMLVHPNIITQRRASVLTLFYFLLNYL